MMLRFCLALAVTALAASANSAPRGTKIEEAPFGTLEDGRRVEIYTLRREGLAVRISTYGGRIVSVLQPDKAGRAEDVVLGFNTLGEYVKDATFQGALIGRYANRIAKGLFALDSKTYQLPLNDGENHLHGGPKGFWAVLWTPVVRLGPSGDSLELTYLSVEGEEGYPGSLMAKVVYSLEGEGRLKIDYTAVTDKPTIVNLTNHSYFNLAGEGSGDVLSQLLEIDADTFTPVGKTLIPTGELRPVAGTPFDFGKPESIGARIDTKDEQLERGRGYDHNFVLRQGSSSQLHLAARVTEPKSGRILEVLTTEPGLQFYSGNFLDGSLKGKSGRPYVYRSGICLEAQHFPDSPNQPSFPSTTLRPGETYRQTTIYRFTSR